jgi:hypothetical protein
MWKACHNILPTKVNLIKRGMVSDSLCPLCEREEEMLLHVLWSCPATRDVWGHGPLTMQKTGAMGDDFLKFLPLVVERCDKDELDLMVGYCMQNMVAKQLCYTWGGVFYHYYPSLPSC